MEYAPGPLSTSMSECENFVNFLSSSKFVEERGENLVFPKSNFVHFSYFLWKSNPV